MECKVSDMCITYKKEKKRTKKWYYKVLWRQKDNTLTSNIVDMPLDEDTSIWQKPLWFKREEVKNLARTNLKKICVKHLGRFSVYNFSMDARKAACCDEEEVWRVEVRDDVVLEGRYGFDGAAATLVSELRLDKRVL